MATKNITVNATGFEVKYEESTARKNIDNYVALFSAFTKPQASGDSKPLDAGREPKKTEASKK